MKTFIHPIHVLRPLAFALGAGVVLSAAAVHPGGTPTSVSGDTVTWGAAPPSLPAGAQATVLHGNPAKEGPFVLRLKFPAGFVVPPHSHSKDELVTVLAGRFAVVTGDKVDRATRGLPAASFIHIPAGTPHYAVAETEAIVQINGVGPFDVTYVDKRDDPRSH